ncbi:hypothetical protein PSTG_04275 [Puccinia striiformis f. sp. tritici PST-78]|uniref:Uncharacterized protein n=1 Tax=Puccinia striiformis f. sp. tritici PST-78 TaxID=1165861 RepID=A0A0L0VT34_9BASI|nr:hypothetical protein PSTG_04275 [Puccinia striiformis f. sp. tritici PST-78]
MEFSLNPGHSLGPIELGSLLWNVLSILRAEQATFKHVQLCWEAGKPATGYLLLIITSPPARLLFEGVHQRLLLIEAHQSPSHDRPIASCPALGEWIHYQNQPLSLAVGPNEPGVTLRVIHRLFGPTYPPAPHTAHQNEMVVSYPGVAFSFSHEVLSRIILSVQPTGEDCKQDEGETVQLTEAYFKPKMPQYMGSIDGDLKSAKIKVGSLLWNVLSILRAEQATFKHVQLCWEAGKPATGYLLLITTSPPARLLFEGVHQRLLLIEAHQSPSHDRPIASCPALGEWIHYQNQPLSLAVGPNEPGVTLRVIHRLFGPTYPPAPHTAHQNEMVVSYPGVAFSFSHEVLSRIILSVQPTGEDCKQDEGETVQLTEAYFKPKMPQYMGSIDGDLKSAKIKLGRIELEESTSINFSFHSSSSSREIPDVKVSIGRSTSEDILCDFGAPFRTFWKEDLISVAHQDWLGEK